MEDTEKFERIIPINRVKIGEIVLESNTSTLDNLLGALIWLLNKKQVKEYLKLLDNKLRRPEYMG